METRNQDTSQELRLVYEGLPEKQTNIQKILKNWFMWLWRLASLRFIEQFP